MPAIFLLAFFTLFGIASVAEENRRPNTSSDTTEMLRQMTGKSKRECRMIARQYGRR